MELKKVLRMIIISALLISFSLQEKCSILQKGDIKDPLTCAFKTGDGPNADSVTFNVRLCPAGYVCNFDPESGSGGTCQLASTQTKSYPGGYCNSAENIGCMYSDDGEEYACKDNICQGAKNEKDVCDVKKNDCKFGLTCLKLTEEGAAQCSQPKADGEKCNNNSDCLRTSGCNGGKEDEKELKGTCTKFFSVKSGTVLSGLDANAATGLSYCESGLADVNNKCVDYTPKVVDDCQSDKDCTDLELFDVCKCDYFDGKHKCKKGTADKVQTDLRASIIAIMEKLHDCNASEDLAVVCNKYKAKPTEYQFNRIEDYNIKLWKRDNVERIKSDDIETVMFYKNITLPNDYAIATKNIPTPNSDVIPSNKVTEFKCAKFSCPSDKAADATICAENKGDTANLYDQCNKDTQICGNPAEYFKLPVVPSTTLKCESFTAYKRYPGEACKDDADCVSGKCTSNTCAYPNDKDGSKCVSNEECGIGKYCNASKDGGVCESLLSADEKCSSTFECKMNLVCFAEKCVAPYTAKIGTKITEVILDKGVFCETGRVNSEGVCVRRTTSGTVNADGLVECTFATDCKYKLITGEGNDGVEENLKCECGFNAEGKAYCPLGDDQSKFIILIF